MNRTHMLAAGGAVVVGAVLVTPLGATAADVKDVFVRNTASSPVPTSAVGTTPVTGSVSVDNLPQTQNVTGSVDVGNLPETQQVAGTIEVGNLPAVQQVEGVVSHPATATIFSGPLGAERVELDVRDYEKIRLVARTNVAACGSTHPRVLVLAPYTVADMTVQSGQDATELIELPGETITLVNAAGHVCEVFLQVYGR